MVLIVQNNYFFIEQKKNDIKKWSIFKGQTNDQTSPYCSFLTLSSAIQLW